LKRVGLTGNIASGKSTVAEVWRELGAGIIDADLLARAAMLPGTPGFHKVLETFGTVDRRELRDIVFKDADKRKQLESIIHPEVKRLRKSAEKWLAVQGVDVAVSDIPLLFEAGLQKEFDVIVLVDAPEPTRIARIVKTRGLQEDEALRMVRAQMPAEEKRPHATYIIENTGSIEELRDEARRVWSEIAGPAR
jgi:dephospho-CoA kinase